MVFKVWYEVPGSPQDLFTEFPEIKTIFIILSEILFSFFHCNDICSDAVKAMMGKTVGTSDLISKSVTLDCTS